MKKNLCKILLAMILGLVSSNSAWAIIDKIEVDGGNPVIYYADSTVPVPQPRGRWMRVHGGGTDLATEVEVSGSGVTAVIGNRKHGIGSYLEFNLNVSGSATSSTRTVTIKYPVGQDTFKIQIVRVGTVSKIEYEQPFELAINAGSVSRNMGNGNLSNVDFGSQAARGGGRLAEPTNLPQDQDLTLVITGTKLNDIKIQPNSAYTAQVLTGGSETSRKIQIKFNNSGSFSIHLFDKDSLNYNQNLFGYKGASSPNDLVVSVRRETNNTGGGNNGNIGGGGNFNGGLIGGGGSANNFTDAAPRTNMLNIFRRLSNFTPFQLNGLTFVTVDSRWCQGMSGNDSKIITVPDLVWGVTNVGTQNITRNFNIDLKANGALLRTERILNLNSGATQDFTFRRQNSTVRVRTRNDRQGCFVSPDDQQNYFEDPQFTVEVDAAGILNENQNNRTNNSRNY